MSYSQEILDELHALKRDAGHILKTSAEEWQHISREKAHTVAADVKSPIANVSVEAAVDEAEVERAFAGRAVPALATALAVGIAIGFLLRRKP